MPTIKTTKKDFELFQKECEKWIELFGITEFETVFMWEDFNDNARCYFNIDGMRCKLALGKTLSTELTVKDEVMDCALHEVLELLLCPLDHLAQKREWNEDRFDSARHGIIHRLSKALLL